MKAEARALIKKCDMVSEVLKSLAHPVRVKVLCQLMDRECSAGELTEFCGIAQSAMSQFLQRMRREGVVESRRSGQFIYYRIADPKIARLMRALRKIYC